MPELSHCLWFNGQAEEAAQWYCSVIPNSRMGAVIKSPVDTPSGPEGSTLLVEFTLAGQPYAAFNGGPNFTFTPAISLVLGYDSQDEVDRVWEAMLDGGEPMACGWITDRYGDSWQVVPKEVYAMLKDPDEAKRKRYMASRVRDRLRHLRFPRPLLIKVEGCDGDINAAYDPDEGALGICYEYIAYIQELGQKIPPAGVREGLTPANYIVGPFLEVLLHELAHAVFDLKKVPNLGREEDAADQVAAFILLRMGKDEVRRVIASIGTMYASEAKEAQPKLKDFANEHGLPAQRFFNLMCISYGSDKKTFGDFVEKGYLPAERAELCEDEYRQVKFAFERLLAPQLKCRQGKTARR